MSTLDKYLQERADSQLPSEQRGLVISIRADVGRALELADLALVSAEEQCDDATARRLREIVRLLQDGMRR